MPPAISTNQRVKIAIIGTGLIGPRHAQAVLKEPRAELVCIVDPNPAVKDVAATLGVPLYESIGEMLESRHRPEAAFICTPNHTHVPVAKELLQGGVHVLVEKPISTDIASGQELISLASHLNLHLLVGHHRRFNPYVATTKAYLSNSPLGRIIALSGIWASYKPASYFASPNTWRQSAISGGPILNNLIHEVDILHYLFGPITLVHAEAAVSQRGYEAEEGGALIFRFESGAVGTFVLSDGAPSPWNFEACTGENPMLPRVGKDQGFLRIMGAEGSLSVGDMRSWSYDAAVEKSWTSMLSEKKIAVDGEQGIPFELQVVNLVGVLRGKEGPVCTGEDGLRAMVVCEAVKRAMKTGQPVTIADVMKDHTKF